MSVEGILNSGLTTTQLKIVHLLVKGTTIRETTQALGLQDDDIERLLLEIFDKLGVSSVVELMLLFYAKAQKRTMKEWVKPLPRSA